MYEALSYYFLSTFSMRYCPCVRARALSLSLSLTHIHTHARTQDIVASVAAAVGDVDNPKISLSRFGAGDVALFTHTLLN